METIEEIPDDDIMSDHSQGVEAVKDSKMNEQCGNVFENKGPRLNLESGMVNYELRKAGGIS